LAVAMTGPRYPRSWTADAGEIDFFDLKGALEAMLAALGLRDVDWRAAPHPSLHPGQAAVLQRGDEALGFAGQLHPAVRDRFELGQRAVFVAELDFEALARLASEAPPVAAPPRFPGVEMDVALVVPEHISHREVEQVIRAAGAPLLESVSLFDLYRGDPVPPDQKSMAYALTYRAADRTLTEAEAVAVHARIEQQLRARFDARIRGR